MGQEGPGRATQPAATARKRGRASTPSSDDQGDGAETGQETDRRSVRLGSLWRRQDDPHHLERGRLQGESTPG